MNYIPILGHVANLATVVALVDALVGALKLAVARAQAVVAQLLIVTSTLTSLRSSSTVGLDMSVMMSVVVHNGSRWDTHPVKPQL